MAKGQSAAFGQFSSLAKRLVAVPKAEADGLAKKLPKAPKKQKA